MTKYNDCYATTVGSVLQTKPIVAAIHESLIRDNLGSDDHRLMVRGIEGVQPFFVTGSAPSEAQIPLFAHPITIKTHDGKQYVASDVRFFIRKDTPLDNIEKSIRNNTEFVFTKSRTILSALWITGHEGKIKNGLQFAGVVYAAWLSECISKNFSLDFKDQTVLNVITHFFYQSLFMEQNMFTAEDKERMATQTIKATKVPADFVFSVLDKIERLDGIEDYCQTVVKILENVRLKHFNVAVLLTIISNSWYGTNAKDVIKVALEHPPTWVSVVFTALNERTYKNSLIFRVAERFGKRGAADEFHNSYTSMVMEFIEKPQEGSGFNRYE